MNTIGSLGFGFTDDHGVLVDDRLPESAWGAVPGHLVYPFVMAGKVMYNFPAGDMQRIAAIALRHLDAQKGGPAADASLFGMLSTGYRWGAPDAKARRWVRGKYLSKAAVFPLCNTTLPWRNAEAYGRVAIDACFDYARTRSDQATEHVLEGVEEFFGCFRRSAGVNVLTAQSIGALSAAIAAGIPEESLGDLLATGQSAKR